MGVSVGVSDTTRTGGLFFQIVFMILSSKSISSPLLPPFSSAFHLTRLLLKSIFKSIVYTWELNENTKITNRCVLFKILSMHRPAHRTFLTSCCHPLPLFSLLDHLLDSIFKSIVHTSELKQRTNENKEQVSPFLNCFMHPPAHLTSHLSFPSIFHVW